MPSLFVVLGALLTGINAQFQLFPNGTQSTENLSQGCITALGATITCDPYIQHLVATDFYGSLGNATLQSSVCEAACGASLASYHTGVVTACSNDPQPWPGIPAFWAGDVAWAAYNKTCLKDPATGLYCVGKYHCYVMYPGLIRTIQSPDEVAGIKMGNLDTPITNLTSAQLCSPCMISLLKTIQNTPYSNYDAQYVQDWVTIQSRCKTGPLPTEPQPPVANITVLPGFTTSDPANSTCLSGNHYTVQPGDDVQKIAAAHGVATGSLKILNGIFPDGSNLIAGQDLYVVVSSIAHKF